MPPFVKGGKQDRQQQAAQTSQDRGQVNAPPLFPGAGLPPLVQLDQPNPTLRRPGSWPIYDPGQAAPVFQPAVLPVIVQVDQPNPTLRALRAWPIYEAGRPAPIFPGAGLPPILQVDQPNPTLRAPRASPLFDPGPAAPLFPTAANPVLLPFDWQNPTTRKPGSYPFQYDPGLRPQIAPGPGIMAVLATLEQPNPTRLRPFTLALYDPGQTGLPVQAPPVSNPVRQFTTLPILGV